MAGLAKHPPVYLPEVSALLGLLHIMFGIKESGIAVADPEQYLYFGYPFFPYMVNRLVPAFPKTSLYKLVLAKFTDGKQADLNLNVQIGLFALPAVLRFLV